MLSHYSRTRKGHQELKARTHKLTARQRALLLIIENVQLNDSDTASVKQLLTGDNLERLLELQLIEAANDSRMAAPAAVTDSVAVSKPVARVTTAAKRSAKAVDVAAVAPALTVAQPVQASEADMLNQQQLSLFEAAAQANDATAPVNSTAQVETAKTAAAAAPKSVFMSYLPYLAAGGAKQPEKAEPVLASVQEAIDYSVQAQPSVQADAVQAEADVVEVIAAEVSATPETASMATFAEFVEVHDEPQASSAELATEVTVEAVVVEAVAALEDSVGQAVVDVAALPPEQMEQVAAEVDQPAETEQVTAVQGVAESMLAQPETVETESAIVEAVEAVEAQAESSEAHEAAEVPVAASVISTMTFSVAQPQLLQVNTSNDSVHMHVEVLEAAQPDDGMLYIGDHNQSKKWQERHIPLLLWTVTMPGTKKQHRKVELPLKFYNMDEFEQVWDAKPPYGGSH